MRTHNAQFMKKYDIGTIGGVYALLSNIHRLRESRIRKSDFNASAILIDFGVAYKNAGLTKKQKQAIYLVYEKDLTQYDASKIMECSQQAVQQHIKAGVKKIVNKYNRGGGDID